MIVEIISCAVVGIIVFWISTDLYKACKRKD
jgi:hypothetical protein